MARNGNQKLKILYVLDYLRKYTDEDHSLTAQDIIEKLEQDEIKAERKSIYSDITELVEYGFDIIKKNEEPRGYYLASREFEIAELKLLVDAVSSSKFITKKKSEELIKKLEMFLSKYDAGKLERQVVVANRIKTDNEKIYYNIDYVHEAINSKRQIQFRYWQWNVDKEKELKNGGDIYQVSPWCLCWDDENYYLVAYDGKDEKTKHFRVDKMQDVLVVSEPVEGRKKFEKFDAGNYAKKVFSMFGGTEEVLNIVFENNLMGVILDRFGKDVTTHGYDEKHFEARLNIELSNQFFGWLAGLGNQARIVEPESAVTQYKEFIQKIYDNYK